MDDTMSRRGVGSNDFEDRFWQMLLKRMDDQDRKLDEIVKQTRRTNGRVTKLESQVNAEADKKPPKNLLHDERFIRILLYVSVIVLLIIGTVLGFDVKGLL